MRKRNVGIFIFDDAEVLDFAGPFEVFSVTSQLNHYEPFDVFTIGAAAESIRAVNGLKVIPDYSIHNHPALDILILSGGQGTRKLLLDSVILDWVQRNVSQAERTLSICSAARLLAKLGQLNEKPFCTHHEVYEHIYELAPTAIPEKEKRFVRTATNLYTSGGISAGIDLSLYVVSELLGKEQAQQTAQYMEYRMI